PDTDGALKTACFFSRHNFLKLGEGPEFRVRGVCTGMFDARTLRLDDCEVIDAEESREVVRLTPDYLPHTPGLAQTYDLATYAVGTEKREVVVVRQIHHRQEGGLTETVITHAAPLTGKSLLEGKDVGKWVLNPKTKRLRLPGGVYRHRLSGEFVEVGSVTT